MPKYKEYLKILEHASNDSDEIIQARINELKEEIRKVSGVVEDLENVNSAQKSDIDSLNKKISGKNDDITKLGNSVLKFEKSINKHVNEIKGEKEKSAKISIELKSEKDKNDVLNSKNIELHNQSTEIAAKNKQLQLQSEKSKNQFESQKKKTEDLTKNLKKVNQQNKEYVNQIDKLQKRIAKQKKTIEDLDTTKLQKEYENITSRYDLIVKRFNSLNQEYEKLKNTNIKVVKSKAWWILGLTSLSLLFIIVLAVNNSELRDSKDEIFQDFVESRSEKNKLSNKMKDLENVLELFAGHSNDFVIRNIAVENSGNGKIGLVFSTKDLTYIRPQMDLYSLVKGVVSIGYLEYKPSGKKVNRTGRNEFVNFDKEVIIGKNKIIFPNSWGQEKIGWKPPGTYRYEFYVNDDFITSQKYTITK